MFFWFEGFSLHLSEKFRKAGTLKGRAGGNRNEFYPAFPSENLFEPLIVGVSGDKDWKCPFGDMKIQEKGA